jgi:hypothetical protein
VTAAPQQQTIDSFAWLGLLSERRFHELTGQMIGLINWYGERTQRSLDAAGQQQLNDLLNLFFFITVFPTFAVPDELAPAFIQLNRTLSNLTAMSCFRNTDRYLEVLKLQPNNLVRMLALYSARNSLRLDMGVPFQVNAYLASLWYVQVAQGFHGGLASETVNRNLAEYFAAAPENLVAVPGVQDIYFGSSYTAPPADAHAKRRVNEAIARQASRIVVGSFPNPKKVAVFTAHWQAAHSVHRTFQEFARALKPHYHLTLFHLGNAPAPETSLFDEACGLPSANGIPDPSSVLRNDFQAAWFPDVGMSDESIFLANLRLAPIQIATLGHSVSTHGAKIDYFISGAAVESPGAEEHYSERLVLLPGMGCTHRMPQVARGGAGEPTGETVVINCPWAAQKINHRFLQTIGALLKRCRRPVRLQIFESGAALYRNDFLPFQDALAAMLPAGSFEVVVNLPYEQYMARLRQGHLALDAFHFGGCNTVSDALYLGVPMVCREGGRWYNRIGPHMLRQAGVAELAAQSEAEYLAVAERLIHEDAWRGALRERLQKAPLRETIYATAEAGHFRRAVDMLIAGHATFQRDGSRQPIVMPPV